MLRFGRVSENAVGGAKSSRAGARHSAAQGLTGALGDGRLDSHVDVTVFEGVVLGLLNRRRKFFGVLGHGNADIGEILRIYAEEGVLRFLQCRNEVAMAHAATALACVDFH